MALAKSYSSLMTNTGQSNQFTQVFFLHRSLFCLSLQTGEDRIRPSCDMRHGAIWLTQRLVAIRCCRPESFFRQAQRWSSTSMRQWSTPLAKTIADAIEVGRRKARSSGFTLKPLTKMQFLYRLPAQYPSQHICASASRRHRADTTLPLASEMTRSKPTRLVRRVISSPHLKSRRSSARWWEFGLSVSGWLKV